MKTNLTFSSILIIAILCGCTSKSTSPKNEMTPASYSYSFSSEKQIVAFYDTSAYDTTRRIKIDYGNNVVFQYQYQREQNNNITDDEYSEGLVFEIASNIDSFRLTNAFLDSSSCYFGRFCFCYSPGWQIVDSGYLLGTKINDSVWHVTANLVANIVLQKYVDTTIAERKNIQIDALFMKIN